MSFLFLADGGGGGVRGKGDLFWGNELQIMKEGNFASATSIAAGVVFVFRSC